MEVENRSHLVSEWLQALIKSGSSFGHLSVLFYVLIGYLRDSFGPLRPPINKPQRILIVGRESFRNP